MTAHPLDDTFLEPDPATPEPVRFTYSHPGQSLFRRSVIRAIERMSGQPELQRLYTDWSAAPKDPREDVFAAALRLLRVRLDIENPQALESVPKRGGLLLVANHPYGILDGLAIARLGMMLRGNVAVLTHSLLCRVPEIDPHLLPVDFSGTPHARRVTGETRRRAADLLAAGKVVAIFPGGSVATANRALTGPAREMEWHPFVGRLATVPDTTTLPVNFRGQNSRLFHLATQFSYPMRIALVFHETHRRMGRPLRLALGGPMPAADLQRFPRADIAAVLRERTLALSDPALPNPEESFRWPPHIRW